MNREDYIEYRKKLNDLSEEEKKQRDLYLKQMANGTLQGPSPYEKSINKVTLKYYEEGDITTDLPKGSIYSYLKERNKNNLDHVALDYYDSKITYRKLFENIDKAAKMFINNPLN